MSEQMQNEGEALIERLLRKEKLLNKLFWALVVSIFMMVSSVAVLTNVEIQTRKDVTYVRENAFNRLAAEKLIAALNVKNSSVQKLIKNEETKAVIKYFDEEMQKVTDDIVNWNSIINPRGAKYSNNSSNKGSSK